MLVCFQSVLPFMLHFFHYPYFSSYWLQPQGPTNLSQISPHQSTRFHIRPLRQSSQTKTLPFDYWQSCFRPYFRCNFTYQSFVILLIFKFFVLLLPQCTLWNEFVMEFITQEVRALPMDVQLFMAIGYDWQDLFTTVSTKNCWNPKKSYQSWEMEHSWPVQQFPESLWTQKEECPVLTRTSCSQVPINRSENCTHHLYQITMAPYKMGFLSFWFWLCPLNRLTFAPIQNLPTWRCRTHWPAHRQAWCHMRWCLLSERTANRP